MIHNSPIGNLYVGHLCVSKFELHLPFLIYILSDKIYTSFERNINFNFGNTKMTETFAMFLLTPPPPPWYTPPNQGLIET
jgi:hypothetical protein